MLYFQIENPGVKNWISHEDNELAHISQYPGNIWVTENEIWANRVGAASLSKQEAQDIVDNIIQQAQQNWTEESELPYPQSIILP
jgi:hypothetical protein